MDNKQTLAVHVSNICQNSCIFCMERDRQGRRNTDFDQSLDGFKKLIDRALVKIKGLDRIYIAGGEPSLNAFIFDIVKYVKQNNLKCHIVSNGGNFYKPDFTQKIIDSGLDALHLSVLSHKSEIHDFMTGTRGSFERAVKAGKVILDYADKMNKSSLCSLYRKNRSGADHDNNGEIRLYINTVVAKYNIESMPESAKQFMQIFPGHYMQSYYLLRPLGAGDKEMTVSIKKAGKKMVKVIEEINEYNQNNYEIQNNRENQQNPLITIRDIPPCLLGKHYKQARVQDFYFESAGQFEKIGKKRYKKIFSCYFCRHRNCPGYLQKYL